VRIDGAAGQFGGELVGELRIEEVLHSFGRFMQVVARQIEVRIEVALPEAVRADEATGRLAAGIGQSQFAQVVAANPPVAKES